MNAVVVEAVPGGAGRMRLPDRREVARVLAPNGRGWLRAEGGWERVEGSAIEGAGVWSHKWYDATGNAVSPDTGVGFPTALRWIAGPQADVGARPQQGFRVNGGIAVVEWELLDDGRAGSRLRRRQFLVGRDAFSGVVLWTRDSGSLGASAYLALDPYKLLVLEGDVVYTVLEEGSRVVALDARSGELLKTYEQSMAVGSQVRWNLVVHGGRLIQTAGRELRVLDASTGALVWSWRYAGAVEGETAGAGGEGGGRREPWRDVRWSAGTVGMPVVSGELGLVFAAVQTAEVRPYGLAIPDRHPPFWTGRIVALDLRTGEMRWEHAMGGEAVNQLAVWGEYLGFLEVGMLSGPPHRKPVSYGVLNAQTGREIWKTVLPPGTPAPMLGAGMMMAMFDDRLWLATRSLSSYDIRTGRQLSNTATPGNATCAPPRMTRGMMVHAQGGYADLATMTLRQPRITRGSCGTEPTLAYGMQYFTPNRCTCSAFLRGHIALASDRPTAAVEDGLRLETGREGREGRAGPPTSTRGQAGAAEQADQWPTMLGDGRRWSSVQTTLGPALKPVWTIQPAQPPTGSALHTDWTLNNLYNGPVIGPVTDGRVLVVALPVEHAVQARSAEDGRLLWTSGLGGRVDSPPTLHDGRVYVGCRDGWIYALDGQTGRLLWRFLAARGRERMVAYGQVESKWPVHGSVLVHRGVLYAAAGYHPQVDGGMLVWALAPASGAVKWKHAVVHEPAAVGAVPAAAGQRWPFPEQDNTTFINQYSIHNLVVNDVLQASGRHILLPGYALDAESGRFAAKFRPLEVASGFPADVPEIKSFLWPGLRALHQNHRLSGYGGPGEEKKNFVALRTEAMGTGQTLGTLVGAEGSSVFSVRDGQRGQRAISHVETGQAGGTREVWSEPLGPGRSMGLAVTSNRVLLVSELPETLERRTGVLQIRNRADGKLVQELALPAAPIQHGVMAARGAVYVTLMDGRVMCLR